MKYAQLQKETVCFMREEFKSVIRGAHAGRHKQQMVNNITRIMGWQINSTRVA